MKPACSSFFLVSLIFVLVQTVSAGMFGPSCRDYVKWTAKAEKEYPGVDWRQMRFHTAAPMLQHLLEDESFVPVFDEPFDKMSTRDREALDKDLSKCYRDEMFRRSRRGRQPAWQYILMGGFFNKGAQLRNGLTPVQIPAAVRKARTDLARISKEMGNLPRDVTGYAKFTALQSEAEASSQFLWPSEWNRFIIGLPTARTRLATEAWKSEVVRATAMATGYDGATSLFNLSAMHRDMLAEVDSEVRRQQEKVVEAKVVALLPQLLSEERKKAAEPVQSCQGLSSGAAWHHAFQARFGKWSRYEAVGKVERQFFENRRTGIAASQAELVSMVEGSGSVAEVNQVLDRCLSLESDRWEPAAQVVRKTAQDRIQSLERRAVLGYSGARTREGGTGTAVEPTTGGEPTEEEMFDAVKAVMDNVNAQNRSVENACQNRAYQNNPVLALQCLGKAFTGNWSVAITGFRKIACEKAQGQAGYVCDYGIELDSNNPTLGNVLSLSAGGAAGQARFVRHGREWLFIRISGYE